MPAAADAFERMGLLKEDGGEEEEGRVEAHFGQSDRVCGEGQRGLGGEEEEEEAADDDGEKEAPRLSILLSLSILAGSSHHSMARVVRER